MPDQGVDSATELEPLLPPAPQRPSRPQEQEPPPRHRLLNLPLTDFTTVRSERSDTSSRISAAYVILPICIFIFAFILCASIVFIFLPQPGSFNLSLSPYKTHRIDVSPYWFKQISIDNAIRDEWSGPSALNGSIESPRAYLFYTSPWLNQRSYSVQSSAEIAPSDQYVYHHIKLSPDSELNLNIVLQASRALVRVIKTAEAFQTFQMWDFVAQENILFESPPSSTSIQGQIQSHEGGDVYILIFRYGDTVKAQVNLEFKTWEWNIDSKRPESVCWVGPCTFDVPSTQQEAYLIVATPPKEITWKKPSQQSIDVFKFLVDLSPRWNIYLKWLILYSILAMIIGVGAIYILTGVFLVLSYCFSCLCDEDDNSSLGDGQSPDSEEALPLYEPRPPSIASSAPRYSTVVTDDEETDEEEDDEDRPLLDSDARSLHSIYGDPPPYGEDQV